MEKQRGKKRDAKKKTVRMQKRRKSAGREPWREWASVVRSNPVSMSVVLERKPNYMALPLAQWRSMCVCMCMFTEKVGLIRLTDSSHFSTALSTHLKTHTQTHMHTNVRSRGNFSNSISLFESHRHGSNYCKREPNLPANQKSWTGP